MASNISGRVTFANGKCASGVEVRVFDKDAPGKGDDDLTVAPGLSDAQGQFEVQFDPGRYMDFINVPFLGLSRPSGMGQGRSGLRIPDPLDLLTPYLSFRYTIDGQEYTHVDAIVPFVNHYYLPEAGPLHFLPSEDGLKFPNYFPGFKLPITLPFLPNVNKVTGVYGLCGGMSAAASDFYLAGLTVPATTDVPKAGTKFYMYLLRRAMDSFAMGESILRFARWMALPEDGLQGTWRLTQAELDKLLDALRQHQLAPIGLVITAGSTLQEISQRVWSNHQVLAYGSSQNSDGTVDIHVYDPNSPCKDDAMIHITSVQVGVGENGPIMGVKCQPVGVNINPLQIRGFFLMPYEPAVPPQGLSI